MATLVVAAPWKDPTTGTYKLRRRVPKRYVPVAGDRLIKHSLHTKDAAEARRRWPNALAWWDAQEAEWERQLSVVELDEAGADALIEKWREWTTYSPEADRAEFSFPVLPGPDEPDAPAPRPPIEVIDRHVAAALRLAGIAVSQASHNLLQRKMSGALIAESYVNAHHAGALIEHVRKKAKRPLPFQPEAEVLTLDRLLQDWETVAGVKPRTAAETKYALEGLAASLGHRDARRVSRDDILTWRTTLKAAGIANNTWNHRLSHVRRVFAVAVDAGKLPINPVNGPLSLKKTKPLSWLPYSDDDAVKILSAARKEARPSVHWGHWVMAFTGMRVAEVLQLTAGDIRRDRDTGMWFIAINEDLAGKSVKTGQSRNVPIHRALLDEGFLRLAEGLAADAPLFPDKKADAHGNRGGRSWQVTGRWVREAVGITDPRKAPDHSWRHRMEDELRAVETPEDVRDALLGHARKTMGRTYGVRGEALRRLQVFIERVPNPMSDLAPAADTNT
jgi:integrase